ncbi:unnamed protein product [Sphagnum troendelagicum]|uniref:Uncharacterized protein n=1 Tax=Sphagnum troendelagicum TaxID=128251 RepID=A0ABP0UD57_9BRYO
MWTSQAAGSAKRSSSALTPEKVIGRIPRLDPLHKFKRYTGGFNVTNVHYWSVGPSTTTTPSVSGIHRHMGIHNGNSMSAVRSAITHLADLQLQ